MRPATLGLDPDGYEAIRLAFREGCVFCDPDPRLVLWRSDHFTVMLDVAPIVEGHVIVAAHDHVDCIGDLGSDDAAELVEVLGGVRDLLEARYGRAVTTYEHGRAGACVSDGIEHRLCHHMHLHALPVDGHAARAMLAARAVTTVELGGPADIPSTYERYGEYLYFAAANSPAMFVPVGDEPVERHLLRTLVATEESVPERADWRSCSGLELLVAGHTTISSTTPPRDRLR